MTWGKYSLLCAGLAAQDDCGEVPLPQGLPWELLREPVPMGVVSICSKVFAASESKATMLPGVTELPQLFLSALACLGLRAFLPKDSGETKEGPAFPSLGRKKKKNL